MKRTAQIWISKPHDIDGIYVEINEPFSKKDKSPVTIDSTWFLTQLECENWARLNGATEIKYL